MEKDILESIINSIQEKHGTPFRMANEKMADEAYPYLQERFPGIRIVKYDTNQWFFVGSRAQKKLLKNLKQMKEGKLAELEQLEAEISKLETGLERKAVERTLSL